MVRNVIKAATSLRIPPGIGRGDQSHLPAEVEERLHGVASNILLAAPRLGLVQRPLGDAVADGSTQKKVGGGITDARPDFIR